MADPRDPLCMMCGKLGTSRCNACQETRYCSRDCQKLDWPLHKLVCKTAKDFTEDKKPSRTHLRAIVFAEDEDRPRYAWLAMTCDKCKDSGEMEPHLSSVLSDSACAYMGVKCHVITSNPILRDRKLTDSIALNMRMRAGGQQNKAFSKISRRLMEYCRGSVVIHGETVITAGEHHSVYDLAASELRHFIDYFSAQADESWRSTLSLLPGGCEQYTGVLNNCVGDQHFFGWSAFEPLTCVLNDTISDITPEEGSEDLEPLKKLGLPLLFCKIPQSLSWKDRPEPILLPTFNPVRAWLTAPDITSTYIPKTDTPRNRAFPTKFLHDLYNTGSNFVCRVDKKPLYPAHMSAIAIYLRTRVEEYQKTEAGLAQALDMLSVGQEQTYEPGAWLDNISKADLKKWYVENLDKIESMWVGARDLPGPYDL